MLTLRIPLRPPSQNDLHVAPSGSGRHRYRDVKRVWERWIPPLSKPARAKCPVILVATRIIGPKERPMDAQNFVGGLKPILDLLKEAGYIVDDSPQWLTLKAHQVYGYGTTHAQTPDQGPALDLEFWSGGLPYAGRWSTRIEF